ncbi:hypothetical protein ACOSQ2_023687 [Xanthoceras sorbifolium]
MEDDGCMGNEVQTGVKKPAILSEIINKGYKSKGIKQSHVDVLKVHKNNGDGLKGHATKKDSKVKKFFDPDSGRKGYNNGKGKKK